MATKRLPRPRAPIQLGKLMVNIATGQVVDAVEDGKDQVQSLMVSLQRRVNRTTGELHLTADDLRRIPQYAFDYRNGGWEDRLKRAFGRALGPRLGR